MVGRGRRVGVWNTGFDVQYGRDMERGVGCRVRGGTWSAGLDVVYG